VNIEKNYLRRSYRIQIPAKVYINNKEYQVKDWSFLGFRINADDDIIPNEEYIIDFELPFVNFIMKFKAKAKCKWKRDNEAGFEFEELNDDTKLLMKEYVEAYIEGRLTEENGLLKLAKGLEIPISTDIPMSKEEEKELNKKFFRNNFIIGVLIILAIVIGYIIYINRGTVYSEEAFVSGKIFYIKSPIEGIINNMHLKPLQYVSQGDLIAIIKNEDILNEINTYEENIKKIKNNIKKIKLLIKKEKKTIDEKYYNQLALKNLKLKNLNKLLIQNQNYLKTLIKQYQLGIIHYSNLQEIKNEIENIKNQINILKTEKLIKDTSSLIPLKNLLINQKKILFDIQNQLTLLKNKKKDFLLKSPIKGKILNIYVKNSSLIKQNQLITSIETNSKGYIIARFTFKDSKNINIGDKAKIYIPANNKIYRGTVTAIGKNALRSNSVFSESNIYSQKDVPVKIDFLEKNDLNDGIFAEVKVFTK